MWKQIYRLYDFHLLLSQLLSRHTELFINLNDYFVYFQILIYRDINVEGAINTPREELENKVLNDLLGFSRIIALLAESKKPIAGHNLFIDTIILHNQFIGPLPNKYKDFKKNIHNMFPILYDTKYLSNIMAKKLPYNECWKSNALQEWVKYY